ATGQSPDTKQLPTKTPAAAPIQSTNADPGINDRRAQARSLLTSLATDARTFQDQTLRARSLARIADALWPVDNEQARFSFARLGKPLRLRIRRAAESSRKISTTKRCERAVVLRSPCPPMFVAKS